MGVNEDSSHVVRYFCGEAGQYRYYPDVDVQHGNTIIDPGLLQIELQIKHNLERISSEQHVISCDTSQEQKLNIEENTLNKNSVHKQQAIDNNNIPDVIKCTLKNNDSEIIKCILEDLKKSPKKLGRPFTKKFICSKCKKRFSNFDFIRRHMRNIHDKYVHCQFCYIFFKSKLVLDQHKCEVNVIRKKKKKCVYECEFCNEQMKQKKLLKLHIKKHLHFMRPLNDNELKNVKFFSRLKKSEIKKYKVHCTSCCIDYNYVEFFKNHYTECCQNSNYICPFCSISKYQFESMTEHFKRHLVFLSKSYPCRLCNYVFLNDVNLTTHVEKIHNNKHHEWNTNLRYTSPMKNSVKYNILEKKKYDSDTDIKVSASEIEQNKMQIDTDVCEKIICNIIDDKSSIKEESLVKTKEEPSTENLQDKKMDVEEEISTEREEETVAENDTEKQKGIDVKSEEETSTEKKKEVEIIDTKTDTKVEEEELKETVEVPIKESTEETSLNLQKTECEVDSDNSEKENQVIQSSTNIQEISIINKQPSRLFLKTCKNIQELLQKLTLKYHYGVICLQCEENFTLETYLNHLQNCLPLKDFKCSFCCSNLVKTGIDKRWNHIKYHLSLNNTECFCDMCEEIFINDYNMAMHAQNAHFM